MSTLNSITLSNLRKFGSDVTIELSPGATILLAPNGTGKTTVFEAIEFGLTGKIARLRDDLTHIIRDDQAAATVSLNFSELTATSRVTAAGKVSQDGDLSSVFPNVSENDVPFLLRLTHILDQRENGWIVNAEEKEAGSQLAKLPIGSDGSKARATLAAVRRSLTEQKNRAEEALIGHKTDLNEWIRLLQERDIAAAGAVGALRPRDRIADMLSEAANQTQSLSQIPPGLLTGPISQEGLAIAHSALSEILQGKVDRVRTHISSLALVNDLVESFVSAQEQLEKLNEDLTAASDAFERHTTTRAQGSAALQEYQASIYSARQELTSIGQQLERLIGEKTAKQEIVHRNDALTSAIAVLREAEKDSRVLREQHEHNQRVRNQHAQIDAQLQGISQTEHLLDAARLMLADWQATEQRISEVVQRITALEVLIDKQTINRDAERASYETRKVAEASARSHYETLSSSADAIRQAVASIAKHLPADQDQCPLCLEPHGAAELQFRVAQALDAINPSLTSAEQQLRAAVEALTAGEIAVEKAQQALDLSRGELGALESSRKELGRQVSQFRTDPILASDSLSLARETLRQQLDGISPAKKRLADQRAALDALPTPEAFEQTERAFNSAQHMLDLARVQQTEAATRLDQAVIALATLTYGEPPVRTIEQLTAAKAQLEQQISDLNGKVGTVQSALETQQHQLLESSAVVKRIEEEIRRVQTRLLQFRASWQELELTGDPLAEAAQAREATLHATLTLLEGYVSALEGIGVEISAWSKLNESQLAQRLIDAQRLDRSEEVFEAFLNDSINAAQSSFLRLTLISEAMDLLDGSLKKEIENVQKHVAKVVPRWQALLKRVVRESRFHEASLKFFSSYNKDRAGVSVPLGNKAVPVPDIASEAQLADLQLTFLLSMAMSHQWSPWKALLLDDPTQHHDLVHASAVFDLLRDYIVDHGFQVVIATHDALQARYFLRKLQNDGIDAKIWTLVPTENGVTAQAGSSKQRIQ
ncbi:chromosome segregation protein SMC [Burkholderia sp. HI2714]|uniref:AAA family ATPase n=1 Tax=Burkholderia sp. HI2714 TaxID=2015359 RepID=UPI000B7A26A2|nr:AAA family ATPase [Burkholderia sp. HI2714]OXJ29260.1 chromosome segregation protein SMC [Burkholderia sp. HI2714]